MRVVEIVTECEHGWIESHASVPAEGDAMHAGVWPICPGGSRRVLEPDSYVLIERNTDGSWPDWVLVGLGWTLDDSHDLPAVMDGVWRERPR